MGKASRIKHQRAIAGVGSTLRATHEPIVPLATWPQGHVDVAITDPEDDECIVITIHGVQHYLHSSTARALNDQLEDKLKEWNGVAAAAGLPGV